MKDSLLTRYDQLKPDQQVLFGRMVIAFAIQQDLMRERLPMLFPGTPLSDHCEAFMSGVKPQVKEEVVIPAVPERREVRKKLVCVEEQTPTTPEAA